MASPIDLALESLSIQDAPNIRRTARDFGVAESTLRYKWRGKTVSREEYLDNEGRRLTKAQEDALIDQINRLTDRGIPPTLKLVKNFAEEIISDSVGKNWTADFVRRHKNELKSVYLKNMDRDKIKSEYAPLFEHFYELICLIYQLTTSKLTIF